jgi:hypothetical protein
MNTTHTSLISRFSDVTECQDWITDTLDALDFDDNGVPEIMFDVRDDDAVPTPEYWITLNEILDEETHDSTLG